MISCLATDQTNQATNQTEGEVEGRRRGGSACQLHLHMACILWETGMQNCFMNYKQCWRRARLVSCLSAALPLCLSFCLLLSLPFSVYLIALTVIMSPSDIHQQLCNLLPLPACLPCCCCCCQPVPGQDCAQFVYTANVSLSICCHLLTGCG